MYSSPLPSETTGLFRRDELINEITAEAWAKIQNERALAGYDGPWSPPAPDSIKHASPAAQAAAEAFAAKVRLEVVQAGVRARQYLVEVGVMKIQLTRGGKSRVNTGAGVTGPALSTDIKSLRPQKSACRGCGGRKDDYTPGCSTCSGRHAMRRHSARKRAARLLAERNGSRPE